MITRFRKWRARRRVRVMDEYYKHGFMWAAGELLLGHMSQEEVESHIYWLDPAGSSMTGDAFDRGASDALIRCSRLLRLEASSKRGCQSNPCQSPP